MGRVRNTGGGDQSTHRAGPLKQTNKKHKTGPHRSKRSIETESRGEFVHRNETEMVVIKFKLGTFIKIEH